MNLRINIGLLILTVGLILLPTSCAKESLDSSPRTNYDISTLPIPQEILAPLNVQEPRWIAALNSNVAVEVEKTLVDPDKQFWGNKPYAKNDIPGYINYWKKTFLSYQKVYGVPWQIIAGKGFLETQGGHTGAGKRGCWFGIKGKGVKGYDDEDKEAVEYQAYKERWMVFSDFCRLLTARKTQRGKIQKLYITRYKAWKKAKPNWEEYKLWAYAMQAHPQLSKSRLSYANCGCKDGRIKSCRDTRLKHTYKLIRFIKKYC